VTTEQRRSNDETTNAKRDVCQVEKVDFVGWQPLLKLRGGGPKNAATPLAARQAKCEPAAEIPLRQKIAKLVHQSNSRRI
jgi:hypothetical protein